MREDDVVGDAQTSSRRSFMTRAAGAGAVAGAVWVAPAIIKVDSAGAASGTCARSTLAWGSPGVGNSGGTVDGVAVTIANLFAGPNTGRASAGISNSTSGTFTPHYRLAWSAPGGVTGDTITMTMTFSPQVSDVCFTLTDLDASTGWRDTVTVSATGPGTPIVSALSTGAFVQGSNPWNGNPASGNASAAEGNVEVLVTGVVSTITIAYAAGPETSQSQHVGVINPNWCTI